MLIETPQIDRISKLSRFLPVGREIRDKELADLPGELPESKERGPDEPPCPILAFTSISDGLLGIGWDAEVTVSVQVEVMLPDGVATVLQSQQASLRMSGAVPRCLEVRWDCYCCKVPCLDSSGGYQRQVLPLASFASWLEQLRYWNDSDAADEMQDADGTDQDLDDDPSGRPCPPVNEQALGRDFPARTAMLLVEEIAECNGAVPEEQAPDWLAYLRHLLIEQMPKTHIEGWRGLRVNFLQALVSQEGFAPAWLDLEKYCALIDEVSKSWGLSAGCPLEVRL